VSSWPQTYGSSICAISSYHCSKVVISILYIHC